MKAKMIRTLAVMLLTSLALVLTAATAFAAEPDGGRLPDYSAEIEAMDKWLDGLTVTQSGGTTAPAQPPGDAAPLQMLTEDELKALTDTMFVLVNQEREQAGLAPLERDSLMDDAAMLRAGEIHIVDSAGGEPHTRPDGTSYKTALEDAGVTGRGFGENIARTKTGPEDAMQAWMDSEAHRNNILRDNYDAVGIGVYQRGDGKLDWIQVFMFD